MFINSWSLALWSEVIHSEVFHHLVFFLAQIVLLFSFFDGLLSCLVTILNFAFLCVHWTVLVLLVFLLFASPYVRQVVSESGLFQILRWFVFISLFVFLRLFIFRFSHQAESAILLFFSIICFDKSFLSVILAQCSLALFFRNEIRLLEQIEKRVGASDEVRMIGVDKRGFDLNQI